MNDLVTPFLSVFLSEHLGPGPSEKWCLEQLPEVRQHACLPACLSELLGRVLWLVPRPWTLACDLGPEP